MTGKNLSGRAVREMRTRGRVFAEWLLGGSMTGGVARFFKSLGVVGIWYLVARILAAAAAILAARLLGKDAFGDVNLSMTVAQFFSTLAVIGLNTAMIRYGAGASNPATFTATAWWLVVAANLAFFTVWAALSNYLVQPFGVTSDMYWFGLVVGLPLTLYAALTAVQQTAGSFGQRGLCEALLSLTTLVVLPLAYLVFGRSYKASMVAYLGAYTASLSVGWWLARGLLAPAQVRLESLRTMGPYAWYNFLCAIGFLLTTSIQRPILKHYLSSGDVAQYSLHFLASIGMAAWAGTILTTVYFPSAARSQDRAGLWRVTARAWGKVAAVLWIGLSVAQVGFILLSGKEYTLDPLLIAMFSTTACVMMVQSTLGQIVGAEGVRGAKVGVMMSLGLGFTSISLSLFLIPRLGVHGAALSLMLVYCSALVILGMVKNRYV